MEHTTHISYRYTLFLLIISMLLLVPAAAVAQDATNVSAATTTDIDTDVDNSVRTKARTDVRAQAPRANMSERREAFEARAAEIRAQAATNTDVRTIGAERARAQVSAQLENRLRTVVANLQDRIERHIERLTSVADRIEARADILAERGIEVDAALALLADARIELRNASIVVGEDLPAEVAAALEAESPRDAFTYVKETLRTAAGHVRTAHTLMRDAVEALKTAVRAETSNASDAVRAELNNNTDGEEPSPEEGTNE